ncbi:MAG: hypothetical protein E6J14_12750 [Chloroflexi bacterium]|nr:MAG: hypothetical protein E6J14_12750 [Chloroflexota bacterium]
MSPKVEQAIAELRASFPDCSIAVRDDNEGGAYVTVDGVSLGDGWSPSTTWVGFRITFQYPSADVYPHFVSQDLRRTNGAPLPPNMTACVFETRSAYQVSRRSNRLNAALDTAALKLHKVVCWLKEQA